jgi:TRAP-type C4-dicarboxylate transport system permease small subunit
MLARALPAGPGRLLTVLVLAAALALSGFAAWHAGAQALDSWRFGSVSFGVVPVPLWLPQGVMTLGLAILVLALGDELLAATRGRAPAFRRAEEAGAPDVPGGGGA